MNPKPEITTASFPELHTFLRGYFHEDVEDEYGTPADAADQFCDDADTEERVPVAKQWQQLVELTGGQTPALNAALKKLGSAIALTDGDVPQVSAIFARCLAVKPHKRVANE